jgi:NAD+ synthase
MIKLNNLLNLNVEKETEQITEGLKNDIFHRLRRKGAVVGISGGIDSAVTAALLVRACGKERVLGIMMPEKESSPESLRLAKEVARIYSIDHIVEEITPVLNGFNCYRRRDEAVKHIFPEYDETYKLKIGLPTGIGDKRILNIFHATIISSDGKEQTKRMKPNEYLQIVAASNFKQRTRMSMLYYHAERLNYAVTGTGNKNEHELGFFVKYGDGGADLKPIIHLFKTQVYDLARYLQVPCDIIKAKPTTDTYTADQTQEEFFYRIPFSVLDTVWFAWEKGYSNEDIANIAGLTFDQVQNIINDIKQRKKITMALQEDLGKGSLLL